MSDLLQRARQQQAPLIEGQQAIFVWEGEPAPELVGDWTGWQAGAPVRLERVEPGLWAVTLTFPLDAYLEYTYWRDGQRLADPLNSRTVPNGLGRTNHYFYMPAAAPTPLAPRRRNVPRGSLVHHVLHDDFLLAGGKRAVDLYRPPVPGPVPLLVVLDGQDYRRRGALPTIVDNLVAVGRMRPPALALVHHAGQARGVEYGCSELYLGFLLTRLLPLARQELDLVDVEAEPGAYAILGASMGGLMALYAGLRAPAVFGLVLAQSGAFTLAGHDTAVWPLSLYGPVHPLRVWLDVGRFESLLDCNRRLYHRLALRGYDVAYREHNGGHNYTSWRNELWHGLHWLLAPG
ncbi:MAG TPA: alpha/beta hydrolase-fold protein [Anaerolineae bacterium]|nr:alpha/beta hydrolase-fold protein [Anaerolineae bacterium]